MFYSREDRQHCDRFFADEDRAMEQMRCAGIVTGRGLTQGKQRCLGPQQLLTHGRIADRIIAVNANDSF